MKIVWKHQFRLLGKSPTDTQTHWLCSVILKKTFPVRRTELEPIKDHSQPREEKKGGRKVLLVS